jgi:tetratricopeptide (TPR) repeat protein
MKIFDEIDDSRGRAYTAIHVGSAYSYLGRYPEALDQYREALASFRAIGDSWHEGAILGELGAVYGHLGQSKEALEHQELALDISRKAGDLAGEGSALNEFGNVYRRLGRNDEALEYHYRALALIREVGSDYCEAQILNDLGATSAAMGRAQESDTHHRAALALATRTRNLYEQARAHAGIAHALRRTDPGDAEQHRDQALAISTDLGAEALLKALLGLSLADDGSTPALVFSEAALGQAKGPYKQGPDRR